MKKIFPLILYILIFTGLFISYPILASLFFKLAISQSLINLMFSLPIVIPWNLFVSLFLLLAVLQFFSFLELRKARNAYFNVRNRIDFVKHGEIICLEGTIQMKEGYTPLVAPISHKESILYCYGNKQVGGGTVQIPALIKPAGESIPLNGWLSGEYVDKMEYDPSITDLSHLFTFMMERKDPQITSQDVAMAPYFYKIIPGVDRRDTFSNHEIIGTLFEEEFKKHKYTEILIPKELYGWALGRWDNIKKELVPLKFSAYIFIIQKDYKNTFLKYISKYRKSYLIGVISLLILAILLTLPIIFTLSSS